MKLEILKTMPDEALEQRIRALDEQVAFLRSEMRKLRAIINQRVVNNMVQVRAGVTQQTIQVHRGK